jgi:hypothetical protein
VPPEDLDVTGSVGYRLAQVEAELLLRLARRGCRPAGGYPRPVFSP